MAFIIKDRVKEATTSTGTGAVSLEGSIATFDTFSSYLTNGDTTYYAIVHTSSGVDEWEVGLGTWNTGNTLTRTTVLSGSNGTSAQDFSSGIKDIFMTYPAAHAALAGDDVDFANVTVTGTVDGRDVAADGSKLDTIESNADVTDAVNVAAVGALMRSGGTMTGNLLLNANPSAALGAATKEYVDTIAAAGIHYHTPVRVEAPLNLTVTYNNGASGVGATLTNAGTQEAITIDGVALSSGDRVLVYEQTDATQNGIYIVTTVGSGSTNWVLTRATDADSYGVSDPDAFGEGDAFFVKEGATGAGELYVMNTSGTITFGTTNITFTVIAETAVYSAGTGITLTGTTFSIGQDVGTTDNVTFNQVAAAIIGNVTGNVTGDVTGNADTATALETARTVQLSGDVTGSATFDGSANINITASVQDDSHAHVISNVDGLQTALDAKAPTSRTITSGNGLTGGGNLTANRTLNVGAGSGITVTADAVSHADTSSQASSNNSGRTYIQDVTLDTFGHVTGLATATETVTDTTYSAGNGLNLSGTVFSHTDTSSQASVNNSNGTVIQDITLDTFGHITGIASTNLDGRYYTETEANSRFVNVTGDTMTGDFVVNNASATIGRPLSDTSTATFTNTGLVVSSLGVDQEASQTNVMRLARDGTSGVIYAGLADFDMYRHTDNTTHPNVGLKLRLSTTTSSTYYDALTLESDGTIKTGANKVFHDGYHPNADKWTTARTLSLTGDASGSVSWDGSGNATLSVAVANDSHNHNHSDGGFTVNGNLVVTGDVDVGSQVGTWIQSDAMTDAIGWNTAHGVYIGSDIGGTHYLRGDGTFTTGGSTYNLWHSGNDGSGSGLDADLLDGVQGSSYLRSDANDTFNGLLTVNTTNDYQLALTSSNSWTGIYFNDGGGNNDPIWHNGTNGTFSIGGGGSNVAGKKLHVHGGLSVGSGVAATSTPTNGIYSEGDLTVGGGNLYIGTSQQRVKLSVWSDTTYGIGMGSGYTFGGLNNDYAMSFQMNNDSDRGFWWGDEYHTNAQGAMALTTDGVLNVASTIAVGYGQSDTTRRTTYGLDVSGTARVTTDLYVGDQIIHDGDTDTYMQFHTANQWRVVTGGAERLEVNNDTTTLATNLKINSHSINMDMNNVSTAGLAISEVHSSTWPINFTTNAVGNDNDSGFWVGSNGYPDMRLRRENGTVRALISSWETSYVSNGFDVLSGNLTVAGSTVWHAGNDGSGSGLDADLLDGAQGSDYLRNKGRTNWSSSPSVIGAVVGQLAWKNYGNNHTIFDASASTTPSGGSCNQTDANVPWTGSYPTLMGWNGSNTYGVRVDSARTADSLKGANAGAVGTYAFLVRQGSGNVSWGSTYAGSGLEAASVDAPNGYIYNTLVYGNSNVFQAGTWRCMGHSSTHNTKGTVFVRIS